MISSEKTSKSRFTTTSRGRQPIDQAFKCAILSKMEWMARQFQRFNDVNSIVHWAGAIASLRNLLLPLSPSSASELSIEPKPVIHNYAPAERPSMTTRDHVLPHKYNDQLSPTKRLNPSLNRSQVPNIPLSSADSAILLQSPSLQQNLNASCTIPLKDTMKRINLGDSPTVQLQRSKLFRLNFHPSPTAALNKISPAPGMHIWEGLTSQEPNADCWAFQQYDGGKEYKILKMSSDPKYPFIVQEVSSGKEFDMKLDEKSQIHL